MKLVLLVLLVLLAVVWFFWVRRPPPRDRDAAGAAQSPKPEQMVVCALCGLHVPHSEAIEVAGRHYCCDEHRQRDSGRP